MSKKISGWTLLGYTSATIRYPPSRPHYEFMILFDFQAAPGPFSEIINRKRRHIGIRIFIRIIYYPINGYPDSKLSVLSIPNLWLDRNPSVSK